MRKLLGLWLEPRGPTRRPFPVAELSGCTYCDIKNPFYKGQLYDSSDWDWVFTPLRDSLYQLFTFTTEGHLAKTGLLVLMEIVSFTRNPVWPWALYTGQEGRGLLPFLACPLACWDHRPVPP